MSATVTKIDWASLSGTILEGGYELKDVLDTKENGARLTVRILGSGGKTGIAYFLNLEESDAEDQLNIWNTLREAPHPNLNRPLTVGRREVTGANPIYMILGDPDEKLAAVIPERSLEWEEAAEVLHSCEKGLAHLHAHGFLHGAVSPQTVEAVGYTVLLGTESVCRIGKTPRVVWTKPQYLAPESKNLNLTTAADVWCLGATLFEVLSQERYGTPGVELEKGLPLAAVIQRCLDKNPLTRCTLKEAPSLEKAPPPVAQADAAPVQAEPAPPKVAPPPPETKRQPAASPRPTASAPKAASSSSSRLPQPLTPPAPPKQVTKEDMALVPMAKRHRRVQKQPVGARIRTLDGPEEAPSVGESFSTSVGPPVAARIRALGNQSAMTRNILAAVGLALLFAAAIWMIIIPKLKSSEQPMAAGMTAQAVSEGGTSEPAIPNLPAQPAKTSTIDTPPVPGADTASAKAASKAGDAQETPAKPVRRVFYRVILGSFANRNDAAAESSRIAKDHPELFLMLDRMKIENSAGEVWIVAVGGQLNMGDAGPLKDRLVKKGLNAHLEEIGQH